MIERVKQSIRDNTTSRHVPARAGQVQDIPLTRFGKTVELAVRDVVRRQPVRTSGHASFSGPAPELADSVQGLSLPATC